MRNFYTLLLGGLLFCLANSLNGQNISIGLTNVDGNVGETVCVDIVGANFVGITGMQFSVTFDTLNIRYVSGSASINGTNVSIGFRADRPNELRLSYSPFSSTGYTDAGPFVIGQLCFMIVQDVETTLTIGDVPIPLEFTNEDQEIFELADVDVTNGTINGGSVGMANCMDGIMNGNETGIDCGGPDCPVCPTCDDGIMNGDETGVDCGGSCTACVNPPTCSDGIMNGNETGVDCGGPDCAACPTCDDGIMNGNETGVDCGGSCTPCVTPPTCSDGIQNGDETGVDCGGTNCAPCMAVNCGEGSSFLNLCVSDVCDIAIGAQACVELTVANFTDVTGLQMDLKYPAANLNYANFTPNALLGGGLQVNEFADGEVRLVFFRSADSPVTLDDNEVFTTICFTNETLSATTLDADRLRVTNTSGMVVGPVENDGSVNDCAVPSCSDGIQNGNETGVDCGGPDCAACPTPTCSDGIQNGTETGIDCGGSCAPCIAAICGEGSSAFNLCVSDVCNIAVGAQACVDLTVANFTNITAVQLNILYPSANLEFAGFTPNSALADALQINEFADGEVRIIFFRGADSPETLADGDVFATLCFTNETAGSTLINADGLRVTNTGGMVVGPIANDGTVNDCTTPTCDDGIRNGDETGVDCGGSCTACAEPTCDDGMMNGDETGVDCGGPDCPACPTNDSCGEGSSVFNLCVGEACDIAAGAQVCVDLTVTNFTGITGLQMDLKYPAANLDFLNFTANAALGDALQINEFADGELRFVLFLGADMPTTLPSNAVFATVCFTNETAGITMLDADRLRATGADGNPLIGPIANDGMVNGCMVNPTCNDGIQNGNETGVDCGGSCAACPPTCSDGIQNGDEEGVDCGGSNCMPCNTGDCGDNTTDPEVCIGSVCEDAGAEVCVPVFVGNFDNLFGFQFSLSYLPGNLEYTRFTAAAALQSGATVGSPSDGTVNLIWNDPDLTGISFPGDEMAFEICFTVQAAVPTPLTFRDEANTLRFFNSTGSRIPGTGNPGGVNQNCGNTPTCSDGIMNGNETSIDCGGPDCAPCSTCSDGIMNGNETGIDCGGPDCAACVSTCGEGSDFLNLCVGEACNIAVGAQACVDLTVSMFTNVTGLQMDLKYPAANLNYASFTAHPSAGGGLQVNEFADGEVRLVFFRSADSPISLDDGEVFATICFTNETTATTILDADRLRVTNTTGMVIGPVENDGMVNGCTAGPTCNDGIQNGNETGIDCGGPDCDACESCTDGIMNGDETGIDCGGPDCSPCATCDDGIMNGDETGIDCGGSCPNTCPTNTLVLNVSDGTAQIGQQVCVPVRVTDFTNIGNISLTVNFDNSVIALASVTANSALAGFGAGNFMTTASTVTVNYTPATPQSLANGEQFFTVCFNVLTGDETDVTITNVSATNGGGTNLTVSTDPGTINTGGIEPYENFTMVVSNETAALDAEVCLDVTVFNLRNFAGLQFTIDYDATKLAFVSATGTGELSNLQVSNPDPGILRVVWFDPNLGSNDVPDGASILSACFTVLEACRTPVTISNPRAADPTNTAITPVDLVAGSVNNDVTCGGGGSPDNLVLDLGSRDGALGTEVCVDLKVTDFTSLTDLSFSIAYDATKVTFTRATNFRLTSITAANFTAPAAGQIRFEWNSPGPAGRTIADGATMVSLCFTVDRFAVTPLNFSNSPIAILARNANNQPVGVVPDGGSINPNAPMADELTFQVGSTQAVVDDEICLPIIAFQAMDMVSFQYTINYDPTKLEYLRMEPNSNISSFRNISVNNALPGILRVLWFDPALNPNTVEDGTALYSICFRVLSTDPTLVTFGDSPTAIEFENTDGTIEAELINGCVNCTPAPVIVSANIDDPDCSNGTDGSIALTVSGGNNLTYEWSPNVSTNATASNLAPGTYCVTITNPATSQSTSDCFDVVDPGPFDIVVDMVSGVSCFGESDGQITIATVGDTGPYLFDWSGNLPDGAPTQTLLPGGSYGVTVTDDNGCVRSLDNITVGEPAVVNIRGQLTNITDSPGRIDATVTGGRMPYQYSWSGPESFTSDQEDIDPSVAGTYCLTVIDNRNCSDIQCFAIIRALAILDTDVDSGCSGEDNGSIDLTVIGGTGGYDYLWSDGNMTISEFQDIDGLAPGDYTVTVTSGADQVVQTITVEEPTEIVIAGDVTNATMGSNGAIVTVPSGGNSPYTFEWADGPTTQNRSELDAGQYCVTVTDASLCERMRCFTVGAAAATITGLVSLDASCADSEDGIIRLTMTNGVAPILVSIPELPFMYTDDDNSIEVSVPPGTYTVNLTDDQGAMLSTMVTVDGPEPLSFTSSVTSDTEDMDCSGMISLDIEGGTSPYTVAWGNSVTGATISQLCAGMYTGTITDENGCMLITEPIEVSRIDEEVVGITDVACADGTEGAINVTITGGVMPYSFSWTRTGSPDEISTQEDLSPDDVAGGVTTGGYTLTVVDASGAMLIRNYTVGISAGFSVTTTVTSNFNGFGVSCGGAADGRIEIVISGQGNFMYEFIFEGQMVGVDSVLENAAAGIYTVTVLDEGNCEISETIEVTAPPAIVLESSVTQISCSNVNDGSLAINPTGGVADYRFLWSNGATTPRISGLSSGTYGVTVTDANNCTTGESFTLTAPEDLAITFDAIDATEGCNGSVQILPLGGSGNYRFTWPQLPNQGDNPLAEGLCPGEYTIQVTDDNECQTVTMIATVLDRRFPCLSAREVITPNGDGLNEKFILFCSNNDEAINNTMQVFNRYGQLVYRVADYDCSSDDSGTNCFEGRTNDGTVLPEGPYYYIFDFTNLQGEPKQQRGALTIVRE
ncbi:cohesin domain-containing protein [Neolewinella persica]|uniref:cohesin domain-containing protein n=1 Tax=Neolewinella persica TaxID=70998 RepID=UPI00039EE132|nr:cohesin domain-containing protein [Neolewinella persica]